MTWTNLNQIGGVLEAMANPILSNSVVQHLATLLVGCFVSGGGVMWIVDKRIDETYAKDEDVARVEEKVESNQEAIEDTGQNVQQLSLIVLDAEISRTENQIRMLEDRDDLSSQERQYLAELRRKLSDLQAQRAQVFAEMMLRE